jgi:hypothetical protein
MEAYGIFYNNRAKQLELNLAAERVEWDNKLQKATRLYR